MICGAIMPDGISPLMKIYIRTDEDMVVGYIGDGSSATLSAMWQSPFENQSLSGIMGAVSQKLDATANVIQSASGVTAKTIFNSMLVWEGQQPPEFSLTVDLMATQNAQIEVNAAITTLLKMCSPELNEYTALGRRPEQVTLNIGRTIALSGVVIKDVTYQLDAPRTSEGYFSHNTVTLQCSGITSLNRSNISTVFIT